MSDGTSNRRATAGRTRKRRKGAPRGGRHGLARPAGVILDEDDLLEEGIAVAAPVQPRLATAAPAPRYVELSRDAEFAYIRSDMRRLVITAAGLLALMLILLVVVRP